MRELSIQRIEMAGVDTEVLNPIPGRVVIPTYILQTEMSQDISYVTAPFYQR